MSDEGFFNQDFWEHADTDDDIIQHMEENSRTGVAVGVDSIDKMVLVVMGKETKRLTPEEAEAFAYGLYMSANLVRMMISKSN